MRLGQVDDVGPAGARKTWRCRVQIRHLWVQRSAPPGIAKNGSRALVVRLRQPVTKGQADARKGPPMAYRLGGGATSATRADRARSQGACRGR